MKEKIKIELVKQGLKRKSFAKQLGWTEGYLNTTLNSKSPLTDKQLSMICGGLGINPDSLADSVDTATAPPDNPPLPRSGFLAGSNVERLDPVVKIWFQMSLSDWEQLRTGLEQTIKRGKNIYEHYPLVWEMKDHIRRELQGLSKISV